MFDTLSRILIDDLHLDAHAVRQDASCADVHLDPLAMVELRLVLQERLGLDISDDELLATTRVADIVRIMEERANSCGRGHLSSAP